MIVRPHFKLGLKRLENSDTLIMTKLDWFARILTAVTSPIRTRGIDGWYLKVFATMPATGGVGTSVKYVITHGIKRIDVGVNIPLIELFHITKNMTSWLVAVL